MWHHPSNWMNDLIRMWYRFNQVFIAPFCYCSALWGALDCSFSRCCGALCTALDGSFSWWFLLTSCLAPCCCKEHLLGLALFLWLSTRFYMIWQCLRVRLVCVFKNWKLLFKKICENTCRWKNVLKCVKYCLKTENSCLKTQTKHLLYFLTCLIRML